MRPNAQVIITWLQGWINTDPKLCRTSSAYAQQEAPTAPHRAALLRGALDPGHSLLYQQQRPDPGAIPSSTPHSCTLELLPATQHLPDTGLRQDRRPVYPPMPASLSAHWPSQALFSHSTIHTATVQGQIPANEQRES